MCYSCVCVRCAVLRLAAICDVVRVRVIVAGGSELLVALLLVSALFGNRFGIKLRTSNWQLDATLELIPSLRYKCISYTVEVYELGHRPV